MNLHLPTTPEGLTIGADPEFFLKNEQGLVYPACGLIGGTKEDPLPVPYGTLQEDNVTMEIGIDPATSVEEWVHNLNTVTEEGAIRAAEHGLYIANRASAEFPMFLLLQHEAAMVFGCEPDYNAYTGRENPNPSVDSTLRTCAGHIHLGYDNDRTMRQAMEVVQYLDWVVGLWTVLHDPDTARRERYGKAGAFRPKPYGLEYRVPSNFWLQSDELKREMFTRVKLGYTMAATNAPRPPKEEVVEAINTHNKDECIRLLGRAA